MKQKELNKKIKIAEKLEKIRICSVLLFQDEKELDKIFHRLIQRVIKKVTKTK
jgi:hypothetical protein